MSDRLNESPRLNVHIRQRGLVVDTTLHNPKPNQAAKREIRDTQVLIRDTHEFTRPNGVSGLAFNTEAHQHDRKYEIDHEGSHTSIGGNAVNVGIAYLNTLRAFDTTGTLAPETFFHSKVTNAEVQRLLQGVIPDEQYQLSSRPKSETREGYYVPHQDRLLYLAVHKPHLQEEHDPLGGDQHRAETHFISSTAEKTPVWHELIARIKNNPGSNLVLMPGKNRLTESVEDEVMKVTDLITFNKAEAVAYLKRRHPDLLKNIEERTDLLAMAISVMGPQRALITNGGDTVALYERGMKEAILVEPPAIEASREIVRDKVQNIVTSAIPIYTGCGDTLVGVFMALEKLTKVGTLDLSIKEQLQLAVNISSCHAWSPASNISYLQPNQMRQLAKAVTKKAA